MTKLLYDLGTVFLTPNRRLAAYHTKQYQLNQITKNISCWPSISILPFNSWIEYLWSNYIYSEFSESYISLTTNQELMLWEDIIKQSPESEYLLQISATAELAKSAWSLLKQWQIELHHPTLKSTEDSSTFLKWAHTFQKRIQKNKWLDQSSLVTFITEKIQSKIITVPKKITLIGFTEISPQHRFLLSSCEKQGSIIEFFHQMQTPHSIQRIALADMETEITTMARWAKKIIDNHAHNPTLPRIACIIPNLEDMREQVNRIFTEALTSENTYTLDSLSLPFNISAGKNIANYPVIYSALQLLNLNKKIIPIEIINHILRSPFIRDAEKELLSRADFANQLQKENITQISLISLLKNKSIPETFSSLIKNYLVKKEKFKLRYTMSDWAILFIDILTEFGWPGERCTNSEEYQVIQRWLELLNEYKTFDLFFDKMTMQTALHYLLLLTSNTVFQPQSPETPIQILGMLEAAEIPFDYVWVMGMDNTRWPPAPKPNPFIPHYLQKTLSMPHATAERELTFCKNIISQLKNNAHEIYFSYALFDHTSEVETQPSSLIDNILETTLDNLNLANYSKITHRIFQNQDIESIADHFATPIDINAITQGGAKLFELQANCPFKAFSELRLFAKPINPTSIGLRPTDRGNIIHKALEIIWSELKDSATLHKKSTCELEEIILTSIETAIKNSLAGPSIKKNYIQLEIQRLKKLLWNWLEVEKSRPPFVVAALEKQYQITIGEFNIALRIDRIDDLGNQEKMIIDYKTGKNNSIQYWFGDRPNSPQLPLYCLIDPDHSIAIAYAMIHTENIKFLGVGKDNINIDNIHPINKINYTPTTNWNEQINAWREILHKLGHEYCQGHAEVNPKNPQETCTHCQLKPFCRIDEKIS